MIVAGYHVVEALLKSDIKISAIHWMEKKSSRQSGLQQMAQQKKVFIHAYAPTQKKQFDQQFKKMGGNPEEIDHCQGVFAKINEFPYVELSELIAGAKKEDNPLLVFVDSVTDPQNLGAIFRSGSFFGASGIVIMDRRAATVNSTVMKVSAGSFLHIPVARVTNLVQAMEEAKAEGFWICGLSEHATDDFQHLQADVPLALVVGNEEKGMRPIVSKGCDLLMKLPQVGKQQSLNAAMAGSIAMALLRSKQGYA